MPKLFYDDEFDALAQTITHSERTPKQCAQYLFPHLKPESAYARLKACLNSEKDERLTLGQIIALCKFCGSYDALHFMADELDHERPAKRAPEDEKAALQRAFVESVQYQKKIVDRLERIGSPIARVA